MGGLVVVLGWWVEKDFNSNSEIKPILHLYMRDICKNTPSVQKYEAWKAARVSKCDLLCKC